MHGFVRWGLIGLSAALALLTAQGCASVGKGKRASMTPEEVYEYALVKMEKKRYYSARTLLQEALPRIPPDDRELLPKVQLAIADSYYLDGGLLNYGEALNAYRNFLTFFPDHERASYAQYQVGMSLFKQVLAPDRDQTLTDRAIIELSRVEAAFPYSEYVMDARRAIEECHNQLGEHERVVGRFYQRRKAWPAAIDRYRLVLQRYPRFDRMNLLLFDLGKCLLEVDNRVEAEEMFNRLAREDTKGKLAGRAQRLLAEYDRKKTKRERKAGVR